MRPVNFIWALHFPTATLAFEDLAKVRYFAVPRSCASWPGPGWADVTFHYSWHITSTKLWLEDQRELHHQIQVWMRVMRLQSASRVAHWGMSVIQLFALWAMWSVSVPMLLCCGIRCCNICLGGHCSCCLCVECCFLYDQQLRGKEHLHDER